MISLALDGNNDLAVTNGSMSLVRGRDAVSQLIGVRLRSVQGDFFADTRVGVPYFQRLFFQKKFSLSEITDLVRKAILETPGVTQVVDLVLTPNTSTRVLSGSCQVVTTDDDVIPLALNDLINNPSGG